MIRKEKKKLDVPEIVDNAIEAIAGKLNTDAAKGTIGDLIRLLQLRDELKVERQGVIRARWVGEWKKNQHET